MACGECYGREKSIPELHLGCTAAITGNEEADELVCPMATAEKESAAMAMIERKRSMSE